MEAATPGVGRGTQRRREARRRGLPYRSSASALPNALKRYYIAQFLPTSTRRDVYPMRALHLAAVQLQRLARGRGVRVRFRRVDWSLVGGGGDLGRVERLFTAAKLARPAPRVPPPHHGLGMLAKYLALMSSESREE